MREELINKCRPKIAKYCAYRERATKEVRLKLESYGFNDDEVDFLLQELIDNDYVNDERFAKLFAGGKFRLKKWGKLKIRRELKQKEISEELIQTALSEIEGQNYIETLESLALNKFQSLDHTVNLYKKKNKVAAYLISKGYESELVWGVLNKL